MCWDSFNVLCLSIVAYLSSLEKKYRLPLVLLNFEVTESHILDMGYEGKFI